MRIYIFPIHPNTSKRKLQILQLSMIEASFFLISLDERTLQLQVKINAAVENLAHPKDKVCGS